MVSIVAFMKCWFSFFCNKKYLSADFVVIKGAFNSVNVLPSNFTFPLYTYLTLYVIFFFALFQLSLMFSLLSGTILKSLTFRELPQSNCHSPLLFDIYMFSISISLISTNFQFLSYADDLVIFFSNKSLEKSILIRAQHIS